MFRGLMAAVLIATAAPTAPGAKPSGKPDRVPPVPPQELARIWDAEHVSPPLPPLLEHDEVERRMQAVASADPSRFIFERVGASLEGRSDLGDLRTYGALRTIDGSGLIAAPLWDVSLKEGQEVDLPDWSRQPSARIIAPGQPAEIVLIRPLGDPSRSASRHVIQTILKY